MNAFQINYRRPAWLLAFALSAFVVGCGGGGDDAPAPGARVDPPVVVVDPVGAACTQGAACVPLASVGNYTILSTTAVSTTGTTAITGHVGLDEVAAAFTGFGQTVDASNAFSTSAQVIGGGRMYANDYTGGTTTADLAQAITDAGTAFTHVDSAILKPVTVLDAGTGGDITGLTLVPGVYDWTAGGVTIGAAGVILNGGPTAVWVFKIPTDLTMAANATVTLQGGALPQNVFWRTGSAATLAANANLKGIVLAGTAITLADGASVTGRLIATTTVTLSSNAVTRPAP